MVFISCIFVSVVKGWLLSHVKWSIFVHIYSVKQVFEAVGVSW